MQIDPAVYKKNYTPKLCDIYFRYARMIQTLNITEYNLPHEQAIKGKTYDHINTCSKGTGQNPTLNHDKNSQQNLGIERNLLNLIKSIYKKPCI